MFTPKYSFLLIAAAVPVSAATPPLSHPVIPIAFEANQGQTSDSVRYLARADTATIFLTDDGAVFGTWAGALRMRFDGARPKAVSGERALPGIVRYISPESQVRAESFASVRYTDLYPGIDLVFYGKEGHIEYDLRVAPHASASAVQIRFDPAKKLSLDTSGNLWIDQETGHGRLRFEQHAPAAFQIVNGVRHTVDAKFEITGSRTAALRLGAYDRAHEVIVDPVLTYSTYLSGSSQDSANAIAIDKDGNMLIAGTTSSPNFPTKNPVIGWSGGVTDGFVTKISADGSTILYSTYLGSPSDDTATAIAVDAQGNAYVTGKVSRPGYFANIYDDKRAYVVKLDPNGGLVYSTTVAGSGDDEGRAIAVDAKGQAYIAGYSAGGYAQGYPVVNGFQQATGTMIGFVTMLDALGKSILYSTNIAGNGPQPTSADAIGVDGNGFIYVAGSATQGMLTTAGAFQQAYQGDVSDAFVAKIDPHKSGMNSLVYMTYIGSAGTDAAHALAVDTGGSVWVAGSTNSSAAGRPFPTTGSAMQPGITFDACRNDGLGFPTFCADAFVLKLNPSGSQLLYSTLMGGKDTDIANAVAIDSGGRAWVAGRAGSSFPISPDAYQTKARSGMQAFLAEIDPSQSGPASVPYSTYLGGSGNDVAQAIALAPDRSGIYIAGYAGSANFPLLNPLMPVGGGASGTSAFVTRFSIAAAPSGALQIVNAASYAPGIAPGSLFSIFGSNLAAGTAAASSLPLPTNLGGVAVTVNGVPAPLLYVSPTQINAQAPFSVSGGTATVAVTSNGGARQTGTATFAAVAPGIFQYSGDHAVAVNDDYSLNASTNPAHAGRWITLYITGQGSYDIPVADGAGGPSSPLAHTAAATLATIGGQPARVLFSGGAPGFAGVSQVNIEVPQGLGAGDHPLALQIGGAASNTTTLTVGP